MRFLSCLLACLLLAGCFAGPVSIEVNGPPNAETRVVFLAGRDSHGAGEHEHRAGSTLLASALRARDPTLETVNVYGGWPDDDSLFEGADALVMYCDGGRGHLINDHLESFNRLLDAGVGVVALHYCVEVPKGSAAASAMLRATGGYFETWWSVNPHWQADYPEMPSHPVARGIVPFRLLDEWYFNMRFASTGVTPILAAVPPLSTLERRNGAHSGNDTVRELVKRRLPQVTAWAFERPDGGRGFGYTGGHFHANWDNFQARGLVLNAIQWVAGHK